MPLFFGSLRGGHILLITCTCKPIGQRHRHHRLFLLGQERGMLRAGATGNPRCAINSIARSIGILTFRGPPCDCSTQL